MRILIVDNDIASSKKLKNILSTIVSSAEVDVFQSIEEYMENQSKIYDIAMLETTMNGNSGFHLAIHLNNTMPNCNIIFVTNHAQYALEAFRIHASGYLLKPVSTQNIRSELQHLRIPLHEEISSEKLIIRTFGSFEVFDAEHKPLHFSRSISKEILAYLVNANGAFVSTSDIASRVMMCGLNTDSSKKLSQYIHDLLKDLSLAGYENIVEKQRKKLRINRNAVECDLFHVLNGSMAQNAVLPNEYMVGYVWAKYSPYRNLAAEVERHL